MRIATEPATFWSCPMNAGDREGPVCDQVLYHLEERAVEHAVLPWCERHSSALVAYSPFGHSRFPDARTSGGRLLRQIAEAHNATPRQVALRFLLRREAVFAIPKSSNAEHVKENARAGDLRLTDLEITKIAKEFPSPPRPANFRRCERVCPPGDGIAVGLPCLRLRLI